MSPSPCREKVAERPDEGGVRAIAPGPHPPRRGTFSPGELTGRGFTRKLRQHIQLA